MKKNIFVLYALVGILLWGSACTDSSPLGTNLVDNGRTNAIFTDTLTVKTATVDLDSVITFSPTFTDQFATYMVSNYNDPILGTTNASIYTQFGYSVTQGAPDFSGTTYDSAILWLAYDTTGFYGDTDQSWTLEAYEVIETMDPEETYYSNRTFGIGTVPIGTKTFTPDPINLVSLLSGMDTLDAGLIPHVRIPLDDAFGQRLFNLDSLTYADENLFLDSLRGIHVRAVGDNDGIIGFNLSSGATRLSVYTTENDTVRREFFFNIDGANAKAVNYVHQPATNILLNDYTFGDSVLFTQGMAGPTIQVDFPTVADLEDRLVINKAELVFTVATLPNDDADMYPPSLQFEMYEITNDGTFTPIEDFVIASNVNQLAFFGGNLEEADDGLGNVVQTYSINMSTRFQQMILGAVSETVFIRVFDKNENPERVVLYGPGHSQYPAKLELTYTKVD